MKKLLLFFILSVSLVASEYTSRIVPCSKIAKHPDFKPLASLYNEIDEIFSEINTHKDDSHCIAVNNKYFFVLGNFYPHDRFFDGGFHIYNIKNNTWDDEQEHEMNIAPYDFVTTIKKEFSFKHHHYFVVNQGAMRNSIESTQVFLLKIPQNPSLKEKYEKIVLIETENNRALDDENPSPYGYLKIDSEQSNKYENNTVEINFSALSYDKAHKPHLKFSITVDNKKPFFVEFSPNKNGQFIVTSELPANMKK
ncbi:hypothetical protein [Sulfuricurvum sp.]|uniref:hypothetical protein n=1 Tax=Sulfuricurvum sp. TaxID=2025608 RepID=UPI003BB4AD46